MSTNIFWRAGESAFKQWDAYGRAAIRISLRSDWVEHHCYLLALAAQYLGSRSLMDSSAECEGLWMAK
jgi:hypothetical protein